MTQARWVVIGMLLLLAMPAAADKRVLLRFDESGHYVHKVIEMRARQTFKPVRSSQHGGRQSVAETTLPMSPIARGRSADHKSSGNRSRKADAPDFNGYARLVWLDRRGAEISRTEVPDPRITHSPSHIDGIGASRTALNSGAWLATGPDGAHWLAIQLMANLSLGLGPEQWQVELFEKN